MKFQSYLKQIDTKEVVTCVLLIVVGYMTAQLFMRKYNGFRVGGQNSCYFGSDMSCKLGTFPLGPGGGAPSPDPCSKVNADDCNKSWWQSKTDGGANGKTPIGVACKYEKDKCITPGTGFHRISGCPTKSCTDSSNSPPPSPSPPSNKVSCSFTGSFDTGGCYKNNTMIDPTDPKYDSECQDCQWHSRLWPWLTCGIIIVVLGLIGTGIGYSSSTTELRTGKVTSYTSTGALWGTGIGFISSVIFLLIINSTVGTYETKKTEN